MNKKTRRALVLFLSLILCFSIMGCGLPFGSSSGGARATAVEMTEEPETEIEEESEEVQEEETSEAEETSEDTLTEKNATEESEATDETGSESTDAEEKAPVTYDTELSDDIYSYSFAVNGVVYQIPMWFKDFEAMGWEFQEDRTVEVQSNQYAISQYWKKDDLEISTSIANLTPNNAILEDCLVASVSVYEYKTLNLESVIELPGGIVFRESTKDDILNAYGEPTDYDEGEYYITIKYKKDIYQTIELKVSQETGLLCEFKMENMIPLEGGNDTITTEVPEAIQNYQASAELSDKIYDMQFELDDVIYDMPCPLAYMLDHGFEIDEEYLDTVVGSGQTAYVNISYGDASFLCNVSNKEDYGTTLINCWVDNIRFHVTDLEQGVSFSGGLYLGMTEAEFLACIEGYEYEKADGYDQYYIYAPGEKYTYVFVLLSDGEVRSIDIECD